MVQGADNAGVLLKAAQTINDASQKSACRKFRKFHQIGTGKRACVYISRHLPSGWQLSPWDCFRGLPVTRPGLSAFAQETSKARLKGG
jgi:hypothetical protein